MIDAPNLDFLGGVLIGADRMIHQRQARVIDDLNEMDDTRHFYSGLYA